MISRRRNKNRGIIQFALLLTTVITRPLRRASDRRLLGAESHARRHTVMPLAATQLHIYKKNKKKSPPHKIWFSFNTPPLFLSSFFSFFLLFLLYSRGGDATDVHLTRWSSFSFLFSIIRLIIQWSERKPHCMVPITLTSQCIGVNSELRKPTSTLFYSVV